MGPYRALIATVLAALAIGAAAPLPAPSKKAGKAVPAERPYQDLLKAVRSSPKVPGGWMVESESYVVHSDISPEYTAAAAARLHRFHGVFCSIFRGEFKVSRKPEAFGFATEMQYRRLANGPYGSQGRFDPRPDRKDLAWFSTPPGEKDFTKTRFSVVQHEASHQLLDAYTDNTAIPAWFNEGLATFFEEWDLDRKTPENILSGVCGPRGLGIALSYPGQKPPPPLAKEWVSARDILGLREIRMVSPPNRWPPAEGRQEGFYKRRQVEQKYDESWCVMTFLIDHPKGQEVFKLFVEEFRAGKSFGDIQQAHMDEGFLGSFEKEWRKFIEAKVLPRWRLPTPGGKTTMPGDARPVPSQTVGHALTDDRRGDVFLVDAQSRTVAGATAWLLRAWSVPLRLYDEAWKAIAVAIPKGWGGLVGGSYELRLVGKTPEGEPVFLLLPAWEDLSGQDKLPARLRTAAGDLISKVRPISAKGPGKDAGSSGKPAAPAKK